MALFMGFIVFLGVRMFMSDKDDLVDKDYYERGMNYDREYQQKKNAIGDKVIPRLSESGDTLLISFRSPASGSLIFSHAKDRSLDREFVFTTDVLGKYAVPVKGMGKGLWRLRFEWKGGTREYRYDTEYTLK